jgi:dihydroorotase
VTSGPAKLLRQTQNFTEAMPSLSAPNVGGAGELKISGVADICIFDPESTWMVQPKSLCSQGKFTPFDFELSGAAMVGSVKWTIVGGHLVYSNNA